MENISHSLPKRSFSNAAFTSHKSVYDDVFGGPPKYALPTLAPRLEDYSEIFGGFHSSRSPSIPVLDLPLAARDHELHFDVRTSGFDYNEVFGDFRSLDCTASFEELFGQSSGGGYDSSDEPWSPEQSGSLSDELDPLAGSDKSNGLSDGDVHQSLQSINQVNASYNKSSHRSMETVLAATHNVTSFSAIPGYTFSHYESPVSWDGEDEHCFSMGMTDDINHSLEFGGGVEGENQFKCSSNHLHSGFDLHINDYDPSEKHESPTSPQAKPFVTVSDISLRTKPSRLPPPSRPPPVLAIRKGEADGSNSKLKASKSYAFDRMADESAPLFFDVEIDAIICADDRENRNKNEKLKHQDTTEPVERKYTRSYSAMQVEEKTNKTDRVSSAIEDEKLIHSHGKKTTVTEPVVEENIETIKSSEATSGSPGVQRCSESAENSTGAVAWREATEYFEVIEENISRQTFDNVKDDSWMQHMYQDAHIHQEETEYDTYNLKEDCKEFKVTKDTRTWHERNQPEMNRERYECGTMQQKEIPDTRMSDQKESPHELIPSKVFCAYDAYKKIPEHLLRLGEFEKLHIDHGEAFKEQPEAKGNVNEVAATSKLKGSPKTMNTEKLFVDPQNMKRDSGKFNQNVYTEEFQRRLSDVEGAEINREIVEERTEDEGTKKHHTGASEERYENDLGENYKLKENAGKFNQNVYTEEFQRRLSDVEGAEINREIVEERTEDEGTKKQHTGASEECYENDLGENYKLKGNAVTLKEGKKNRESCEKSYVAAGHCKSGDEFLTCDKDMNAGKLRVNEMTKKETLEQNINVKEHKLIQERDVMKERNGDGTKTGDNILRFRMVESEAGNEAFGKMGCRDAGLQGQLSGHAEEDEPIERSGNGREVEMDLDGHVLIEGDQLKVFKGGYKVDEMISAKVLGKHDTMEMLEVTRATYSSKGNSELNTVPEVSVYESETVMDDTLAKGRFDESRKNRDQLQDKNIHHATDKTVESPCLPKQMSDSNNCGTGIGISRVMPSACEYAHEPVKIMLNDNGVPKMNSAQNFSKRTDMRDNFKPSHVVRESANNGRKVEDATSLLKHNDAPFSVKNTSQWIERRDIHMRDNLAATAKDQKVGERVRRETTTENEHMRKLEEEWEREREREKDRMAVDKTALEAHERSYSEAREKAQRERAAVERATAEARQRAMAETRERLEKASMETRLRAERAAVERATAEARQRAAEKLMAHKAAYVPNDQVERSIPDRFSASSRSTDTRQSYLSSDLHFQSAGISNGWRSYSLAHEGAEGESPQRCKARLERYKRTAERAANALAEKNRRDLIAQREREERNRVAEALDAEVKRWSSGKEGNLRALLSTLQYILGPNSGWHPIPLTEVITSAAVKRAYRKATLCVHPDKLQQRGATIQQKYICEKVFDLLKEAWNKFNSEER